MPDLTSTYITITISDPEKWTEYQQLQTALKKASTGTAIQTAQTNLLNFFQMNFPEQYLGTKLVDDSHLYVYLGQQG